MSVPMSGMFRQVTDDNVTEDYKRLPNHLLIEVNLANKYASTYYYLSGGLEVVGGNINRVKVIFSNPKNLVFISFKLLFYRK